MVRKRVETASHTEPSIPDTEGETSHVPESEEREQVWLVVQLQTDNTTVKCVLVEFKLESLYI